VTPADTLIYAFDFGYYGKPYTLRNILTEINPRMREISGIEDYFDLAFIQKSANPSPLDHCYHTFTRVVNGFTLDVRFIGLCGVNNNVPNRNFVKDYPTADVLQIPLGGKGGAKVWTQEEMDTFVSGYSDWLKFVFRQEIASTGGSPPGLKDPVKVHMSPAQVLSHWAPKCVWPSSFLENNATLINNNKEKNEKNFNSNTYLRGNILEAIDLEKEDDE